MMTKTLPLVITSLLLLCTLSLNAQNCCDNDEDVDLCYLSGADYCGFGGSCADYSLDGLFMINALTAKLNSPANFGPGGTVDCNLELKELEDVSSVQAITDCGCDVIFLPNVFSEPGTGDLNLEETYIPEPILQNIYDWSLECTNNLVIATQAEANLWGYTTENANINPNTPVAGTSLNTIFEGPFGSLDFFNQGGTYQGVFTGTPGTGIEVLANDALGNPTAALDLFTNDIVVGDIGIFCSGGAGQVSPGAGINNNNDILICNIFALACQLAVEANRVSVNYEICPGETVILPDGQVINSAGIYVDTLIAFNGCDSIITTSIAYGIEAAPTFQEDELQLCVGDTVTLDGTFPNTPIPFYENPTDYIIDPTFTNIVSQIPVTGFGGAILGPGMIQSICLNIDHTWADDLDIFLVAPNGELLELSTDNGFNNDNYINTCFTETATITIGQAGSDAPFTGDWLPEGDWSTIYGSPVNGLWQLIVRDDTGGFVGTLRDWSITFEPILELSYTWATSTGLSCDDCPITNAAPLASTTYFVTATDPYGCTSIDSISINLLPVLASPMVFCDTVTLDSISIEWGAIPGALGYEVNINGTGWVTPNNGNLGHFLNNLMPLDTFEIAVRAFDDCSGEETVVVCSTPDCNRPVPLVDLATSTSCADASDGTLNISATGGSGNYTFELGSTTNSTGVFDNLSGGTYEIVVTDEEGCAETLEAVVPSPDSIILTAIEVAEISCNGVSDGALTVVVENAVAPFVFEWDGVVGDSILSDIGQGSYDLLLTDANACTAMLELSIEEPNALSLETDSTQVLCSGGEDGSASVIPTGGTLPYTFLWDAAADNQTSSTAIDLTAGGYVVTVTDANDCMEEATVQVEEPSPLLISTNFESPNCFNTTDGFIEVEATGGTPLYSYSWNDTTLPSTPDVSNLDAGSYIVTVTDSNNCEIIEEIILNSPDSIVLSFQQTDVTCFDGSNGLVNVEVTGAIGTPSFDWNNGASNASIENLIAGEYCVAVEDENGCQVEDCIIINQPPALILELAVEQVSCDDNDDGSIDLIVEGGVAPYFFEWSNSATEEDLTGLTVGSYTVSVTDDNGCEIISSTEITQAMPVFTLAFNTISPLCNGENNGSIDLTVNGLVSTFTYQWSGAGITASVEDLENISAGTYEVLVTDAAGCELIGAIELEEPEALVASIESVDISCFGFEDGNIVMNAEGGILPYLYSIDGGENFQDFAIFTNLEAGNYSLVVQDANGCEVVSNSTITEPEEVIVTLEPLAEIMMGDSYTLDAIISPFNTVIDTLFWSPADSLSCINCLTPTANPIFTTEYNLLVSTADGCTIEERTILIVDRRIAVYVPNAFSPNGDGRNDEFLIFAKTSNIRQVKSFQIFDRWGELIFSEQDFQPNDPGISWDGTFNGEPLSNAVFTWIAEIELSDGQVELLTGDVALLR
jgi:gliding motility-associated-like protein